MLRFTLVVILAVDEDCARQYLRYISYYAMGSFLQVGGMLKVVAAGHGSGKVEDAHVKMRGCFTAVLEGFGL